ncbi:Subtilisin-like protease [Platanthera zijinensis]|uniref:Subtilisin-like protease n=1 Tax=Platanthera zijinensis TaxID=2320716 RepID=A0AAP0BFI6_9ASPA
MVYTYREEITGFAAWITQSELKTMESVDGFLLANKDRELEIRTTYTPKLLGLEIDGGMWYESFYGHDKIIAVIDTGVKPTHPSFSGQGMAPAPKKWNGTCYWTAAPPLCNNKIIGAKAFEGGHNASPLDIEGHGTHTASIAAGNFVYNVAEVLGNARGTSSGIAAKAHLAIYKASTDGSLLKAIDEAIRSKVDVISMSLGDALPNFDANSIVIGSFAAVTKGIVPCAAAPNSGPYEGTIDNDAPWIITIGAASTDRRIKATVKLGDGREFDGESAYHPSNYGSPELPLVSVLRCFGDTLNDAESKGKIVLCNADGDATQTGENVLKAGGLAMILLGDSGNTTFAHPHVLPASYVTEYAGEQILDYSSSINPTASIIFKGTQFNERPSPAAATFSGRGPSYFNGGIIKPDVIAPGVNILAAWPFEIGLNHTGTHLTFSFQSGASMATPHVAGVAALLMHNHPTWTAAEIKSSIMTTAHAVDADDNPIEDQSVGKKASVYAIGSGHIDPIAANDPGLVYNIKTHDYIRYLCGSGLFDDKEVSAIVRGNITCSTIRELKVEELNYPSIGVTLSAASVMKTVRRTVTNVGDDDTTFTVDFDEPKGVNIIVTPVVLHFNKAREEKSFDVTLSFKSVPMPANEASDGQLSWKSGKYLARIPIVVTFA